MNLNESECISFHVFHISPCKTHNRVQPFGHQRLKWKEYFPVIILRWGADGRYMITVGVMPLMTGTNESLYWCSAVPPEMWPLLLPHTGSYPSTHARCRLAPRGHWNHNVDAQLPVTLQDKKPGLQLLAAVLIIIRANNLASTSLYNLMFFFPRMILNLLSGLEEATSSNICLITTLTLIRIIWKN